MKLDYPYLLWEVCVNHKLHLIHSGQKVNEIYEQMAYRFSDLNDNDNLNLSQEEIRYLLPIIQQEVNKKRRYEYVKLLKELETIKD